MFELLIGLVLLILSLSPKGTFHWGTIAGRQTTPPIEPSWIPRLFMLFCAIVAIADGIFRIRHR